MCVVPFAVFMLVFGVSVYSNSYNQITEAQVAGRPPYDPSAIFNTPIPHNYPTDPNSSAVIARISSDWNTYNWSYQYEVPPVYIGNSSSPKYKAMIAGKSYSVPVPSTDVKAGAGSDYPLILLNTTTQEEFRFWQATVDHGSKTISSNGAGIFYYNNDGSLKGGLKSLSVPFVGVGTGSGLSYYAGLVTNEDYDSGIIRHAIRFANSCSNSSSGFRPPATRTDQPHASCSSINPGSSSSIQMGSVLQLDKSINCDQRTVPTKSATSKETKLLRMVCKAMQDYGIIMLDGTAPGGGANFYLEDSKTAGWGLDDKGKGNYGWIFRPPSYRGDGVSRNGTTDGIPVNKLRVLARPASATNWGAGTPVSVASPASPTTNAQPSAVAVKPNTTVARSQSSVVSSNSSPVPVTVPKEADGTLVVDIDGDGLNDRVQDVNNDGYIDPATEVIDDGSESSLSHNSEEYISQAQSENQSEATLPRKIATVSYAVYQGFSLSMIMSYVLMRRFIGRVGNGSW